MLIYNLLEYSKNYRNTTGSSWNYYRDEPSDPLSTHSESFKHKTSIEGKILEDNDPLTDTKAVITLKHLSNFWRTLNIPSINFEVELILNWSENCALDDMATSDVEGDNLAILALSGEIKNTKLYVPVVTLSTENDAKFLEQLKPGFKRTIKWNKYKSKMIIQSNNNNLSCLIDPIFTKVNR